MKFLFHTIIAFNTIPVYYNVLKIKKDHYFLEVLENPGRAKEAEDFILTGVDGEWECSIVMNERQVQVLVEEVVQKINSSA